jgi:tetratricopeptide (TPR) repeat protein
MATAQTYLAQGLSLANQSQWQQAINCWQQAITIEPNFVEAHFNMGIALRKLGKTQEALTKYQQVLAINPNHGMTYFSLGNLLFEEKNFTQALACYSKAIQIDPSNSSFYFQLGLVCHQLGRIAESIQCFEKVLGLDPDRADARENLAKLRQSFGDQTSPLKQKFNEGLEAYNQGKVEESIGIFTGILAQAPDYIPALYNLAIIHKKAHQLDRAMDYAKQVIALDPKYLDAHKLLADGYISRGEPNQAIGHYLQAIALSPEDRWLRYALRAAEWQQEIQRHLQCHPSTVAPQSFKVLHVGCGPKNPLALAPVFRNSAWQEIRLDIDPEVEPDLIGSITDLSAVADNSMDALYSSHNLEHIFRDEVPIALAEFFRVLKPGGLLLVTMPDLQAVAKFVAEGKLEEPIETYPSGAQITAIHAIFGEGNGFMLHRTGFTTKTLRSKLTAAGFQEITICSESINLWGKGYKP